MTSQFDPLRAETTTANRDPSSSCDSTTAAAAHSALEAAKPNEDAKSSSTEGPDSQNSAASSPTFQRVMVPSYPEGVEDNKSMMDGSNGDDLPLLPLYFVRFVSDPEKSGEVIKYKLRVGRPEGLAEEESSSSATIEREYDDFEFLHHNLVANNEVQGVIVPPLPSRPTSHHNPKAAESRSRQQLGSGNRSILADDLEMDTMMLEKFMQQVLHHPVFGRDGQRLSEFLDHPLPPVRAKLKKAGFLSGILDAASMKRGATPNDEDFFVKEREWASLYAIHIKDTCDKFQSMIQAQRRVANQVSHLATLLGASVGGREGTNGYYNKLNSSLGACLEDEKSGLDDGARSSELTLSSYLTLWDAYVAEENGMLHRRAVLVGQVEAASKALAKATLSGKPAKTSAALLAKEAKDTELLRSTEVGVKDVKRFHHQRLHEMKEGLVGYANGQLENAKATQEKLSGCVDALKAFELPRPKMEAEAKTATTTSVDAVKAMNIPE